MSQGKLFEQILTRPYVTTHTRSTPNYVRLLSYSRKTVPM